MRMPTEETGLMPNGQAREMNDIESGGL